MTRQTVYNLFGSKEAVFRAMVEMHWDTIARDGEAVLAANLDVTIGPDAVLQRFGEAIVRFISETEQVAFTRLVISESHGRSWIAEEFYRLGKEPLLDGFVVCLRRLNEAGQIGCAPAFRVPLLLHRPGLRPADIALVPCRPGSIP